MKKIQDLKTVLHFKKDNYVYRYVLVDRFKHDSKYHYGFEGKVKQAGALAKANINPEVLDMTLQNGTRLGDHPEIIKGFAKIAGMMQEDKIVATESENAQSVNNIEDEISSIVNDRNSPYWNKGHPDHDKMVQQVYTLREMLNAK